MDSKQSINPRVAVVTGGAMGIGAEVSARLAQNGLTVLVADINEAAARKMASELCDKGWIAAPVPMDVGRAESIAAAFPRLKKSTGAAMFWSTVPASQKFFPSLSFRLKTSPRR